MSLIRLEGVSKSFQLGEHIVTPFSNVDLTIDADEFLVLLGPSGSGKSTLLNLLAAIDTPDAGAVFVGDTDVTKLSAGRAAEWRARTVGFVFQDYSLVPVLTAYENVEIPLWLTSMTRAERHRRVTVALEAVDLADRHAHLPRQLSGGQQQRVAIARAIVADPTVIVADEPTGNLDEESAREVLSLLKRLNREFGKTVVMVTHDMRAVEYGTRALHLDKGSLHTVDALPS